MVWCGVVFFLCCCGVVWCGVVWCSVVWCGGVVWCGDGVVVEKTVWMIKSMMMMMMMM